LRATLHTFQASKIAKDGLFQTTPPQNQKNTADFGGSAGFEDSRELFLAEYAIRKIPSSQGRSA